MTRVPFQQPRGKFAQMRIAGWCRGRWVRPAIMQALPQSSREHRKDRLNVVRGSGQQCIVTRLALRGGFQDELGQVRFDCRCRLVQRDLGHHLIKGRPHGLDEFWTVARHDTVSRLCGGSVAGLTLIGQTQSREQNHANVTFDVFSISQRGVHAFRGKNLPVAMGKFRPLGRA